MQGHHPHLASLWSEMPGERWCRRSMLGKNLDEEEEEAGYRGSGKEAQSISMCLAEASVEDVALALAFPGRCDWGFFFESPFPPICSFALGSAFGAGLVLPVETSFPGLLQSAKAFAYDGGMLKGALPTPLASLFNHVVPANRLGLVLPRALLGTGIMHSEGRVGNHVLVRPHWPIWAHNLFR